MHSSTYDCCGRIVKPMTWIMVPEMPKMIQPVHVLAMNTTCFVPCCTCDSLRYKVPVQDDSL